MDNVLESFKKKLSAGECVYGPFMKTADPMFVEIAGIAGFDFSILDTEHGPVSLENQQNNIRAALLRGMLPIIRVKDCAENTIGSALDVGALGIQVPQIKDAQGAKKVVEHARFYPLGMRGVCRFVRAANYSDMDRNEYFSSSKDVLVILQLEGVDAIKNIDEILEVDGIDIIFVGPYDLSQSLGVPGEVDNPLVVEKMNVIVEKAKQKNITVGTFVDNMQMLKLWKNAGVQYLSYSVDAGIFTDACKTICDDARKI